MPYLRIQCLQFLSQDEQNSSAAWGKILSTQKISADKSGFLTSGLIYIYSHKNFGTTQKSFRNDENIFLILGDLHV